MSLPLKENRCLIVLSLFLCSQLLFSQKDKGISGIVASPQNEPLEFASVVLLHPQDSTMINFTTTDVNGKFNIFEDSRDTLLLQIHSTGYISHFKTLIYQNKAIDLNTVILEEDIGLLDEIIISAVIPIQIKKDTVSFNTSSFKINYDDNIEEMLEKLPGMEIDSDGAIMAQGNEVTKIYVDGKEFFGGDPSVVLKNLSADVIANIEVIDKKSDEAELTGINDGNKQVVLNFTLKKDKKNQGFGKASAGIGLNNRYFGNGNYNRFSSKEQFSAVIKTNNINVTGSNIKDFLQNADGLGDESDEENNFTPKKRLWGFLETQIAALHYGLEFKKNESLNTDYTYSKSRNNGSSKIKKTTFRTSSNFNSEIANDFDNEDTNHKLNFNYKNQSNATYSYFAKGYFKNNERTTSSKRTTNIFNDENNITTFNDASSNNKLNQNKGNIQLKFNKKLNERGRSLNLNTNIQTENRLRNDKQVLLNKRRIDTEDPKTRNTETDRNETLNNLFLNYSIRYNSPLGNNHFIKIEANNSLTNSNEDVHQSRNTISDDAPDTSITDILMFKYKHKEIIYKSKAGYSYNSDQLNIYAGGEYFDLTREFGRTEENSIYKKDNFINPISFIQYTPKKGKKYRLSYQQKVRSPKYWQSSTVINDLIPNSIRKGNPDLNPELQQELKAKINIHDYTSSLTFYGRVVYSHSKNAIIPAIEIDDDFIRTRSFINSGTKENFSSYFSFSKKIKRIPIRYTLKTKNTYTKGNSLVNFEINEVSSIMNSLNLKFENHDKRTFDLKFGAELILNNTNFSIEKDLNRKFSTQHYYTLFDYDINKKISLNTQFDYYKYTDSNFSPDTILPLWNSAVSYSFTAKKNNVIKLLLIDMLNRNIDIQRRSSVNFFQETVTESLGFYAVLSYTHRINSSKSKGSKKKNRK